MSFCFGFFNTYDNEGRMLSVQYPGYSTAGQTAGPDLGYAYDSMGRLNTMTDLAANNSIISGTTYGPSNQMLSIAGQIDETRTYNSMLQVTSIVSQYGGGGAGVNLTYSYSATQNNGKLLSQTDNISGEQVTYTYDALNRLASATAASGSWGQSYSYDGFGNLTAQNVTAGTAPSYNVVPNPATNQVGSADANGNTLGSVTPDGGLYVQAAYYDVENRFIGPGSSLGSGSFQYSYAPGNKRVWRGNFGSSGLTVDEVTFWGVNGQKLASYSLTVNTGNGTGDPPTITFTQTIANYYFGKRLVGHLQYGSLSLVFPDRLGSIGHFYPYGQEKPSATTNGTEKYTGYFRDSETGFDYADQRYHNPGTGRFLTPDPYRATSTGAANPRNPASWNHYSYALSDPIAHTDPRGLYVSDCTWSGGSVDTSGSVFWGDDLASSTSCSGAAVSGPLAAQEAVDEFEYTQEVQAAFFSQQYYQNNPDPSCVQSAIGDAAQATGLDLTGFTDPTVEIVGTVNGEGGTYGETELNLFSTSDNVATLEQQMISLGYVASGPNCPANSNLSVLVGNPHANFNCNFRAPGLLNSVQVNVNSSTGQIQIDVDPFNPSADPPLGVMLHGLLQVLPNKISGTDNTYGCPSSP